MTYEMNRVRGRTAMRVALALGLALMPAMIAAPVQAQQSPTPLIGQDGMPIPRLAPGERTRAILQMQNGTAASRRTTISGAESQKMVDNYIASIGKGGAGPTIEGIGEGAAFASGGN